ncbi:NUDIX hydrolase [Methylobacterium gossipiicola]|uniref:NUDIX hydrolase n=1 Tax=Methylobacterium gossipiicola TaxID=582675 RepID=UPI000B81CA10|nr:NUDIX domain-containing protein [Methylobacterium gossipiicola]
MLSEIGQNIRVAAALVVDDEGCPLLVRRNGTKWFMQADGRIEPRQDPLLTLRRELYEEIGVTFGSGDVHYPGRFDAPAANEAGRTVEAELFRFLLTEAPIPAAEIEEAIWVRPDAAERRPLAPLIRDHVLRFARVMSYVRLYKWRIFLARRRIC